MRADALRVVPSLLLTATLLVACAYPAVPPATPIAADVDARTLAAERALLAWRTKVAEHVASAGQGDPAVLAELPARRSPASLRPAQVVFAAIDIDAIEPGRDGQDAIGLMVGRRADAAGVAYVFVVGVIERRAQRPVALIDVRPVALTMHRGEATWVVGPSDARALAQYEGRRDPDTVLRFPALFDRFALASCGAGLCVDELSSGARWRLY